MKILKLKLPVIAFLLICICCNSQTDVPPPTTSLVGSTVYGSNSTAVAGVTGILQSMAGFGSISGGTGGISTLLGLSADEFSLYPDADAILSQAYANALLSNNPVPIWNDLYNYIYQSNAAIEGLSKSTQVTPSVKDWLVGEAKFIRAFCNFYLVNIYGNVPLVLTTDYRINATIPRSSQDEVYQQIILDLKDAQNLLTSDYRLPTGVNSVDKARPNKGTATALLARVYLYLKDWNNAEIEAAKVISNSVGTYSLERNLDSVFLKTSKETIWQLELPNTGLNTSDASIFLLSYLGGPSSFYPISLSKSLIKNFELNDLRRKNWVDSMIVNSDTYYFPFKYKLFYTGMDASEYPIIFRLAEQYLIRAEARIKLGKLAEATSDINVIRERAGLLPIQNGSQANIMSALMQERRIELFSEYGHRWLDIKRGNHIDSIMNIASKEKNTIWKSTAQLFPIPLPEIEKDPFLIQNPGYN